MQTPPWGGTAHRRRAQQARATARHVGWLSGLLQGASSHHTGNKFGPDAAGEEVLQQRLARLERIVQSAHHTAGTAWQTGTDDGSCALGNEAGAQRRLIDQIDKLFFLSGESQVRQEQFATQLTMHQELVQSHQAEHLSMKVETKRRRQPCK